jgi:hypothetical protein
LFLSAPLDIMGSSSVIWVHMRTLTIT